MVVQLPEYDGVTKQVQTQILRPLRQALPGFRLFAGREFRTESWTAETLEWWTAGDMKDAIASMDLPPVQSDSVVLAPKTVRVPLLTKDIHMGGRKAAQVRKAGLDPVLTEGQGRALAREMERALMVGYPANVSGPAAQTGLLNDPDSPASVPLGAFTDAEAINDGISLLLGEAADSDLGELGGPKTLLINRANAGVFQKFIAGTNVRIGDNLPGSLPGNLGGITNILLSKYVAANTVKLVDTSEGNYHAISPQDEDGLRFGIGNATVGEVSRQTLITAQNPIMMGRTWRALNVVVARVVYPDAVTTGSFTTS